MTQDEDPTNKIVRLIKASAPAVKRARRPKPQLAGTAIAVTGNGNLVAGGDVHHTTNVHHHVPARPLVVVKTGDGTVDAAQKAELQRLLALWMAAHNAVKTEKLTFAAAWGSFNKAMKINKYDELRPESFPRARAWLQRQAAIKTSMKSAPRKMPKWRTARYGAIKAKSINQLGDEHAYVAYTQKKFGKSSLTELSDVELEATYRYVMTKVA